jgi:hypothetical protein
VAILPNRSNNNSQNHGLRISTMTVANSNSSLIRHISVRSSMVASLMGKSIKLVKADKGIMMILHKNLQPTAMSDWYVFLTKYVDEPRFDTGISRTTMP